MPRDTVRQATKMKNALPTLIEKEYAKWENIHVHGCSDPSWADGVNLNLIRNHIISYKQQMAGTLLEHLYLEIFNRPLPPEVDNNYMANADNIRSRAVESLKTYQRDRYFLILQRLKNTIPPDVRKNVSFDIVLGYVSCLDSAIREDYLLALRRHRQADPYLSSFECCVNRIRAQAHGILQKVVTTATAESYET